jgi:NAD-dependent histone deacetylase SIR2
MKRKRSNNGQDKKRKKFDLNGDDTSDEDEYDNPAAGVMKPDITFFGEPLPDTFSERLTNHDKARVDLVIVIGTSLKVAPVSEVIPYLPANIPQMYISRTPVSHVNFDIDMLGDCDVVVAELCRRAGWDLRHEMIPEEQEVKVELIDGFTSRHQFTEKKR